MNKMIHGSLLGLFVVSALCVSPASHAISFKNVSEGIVTIIKNCLAPEQLKAVAKTSAHALWKAAKVSAIVTVLANICMPERLVRSWWQKPGIGRFIFRKPRIEVASPR